MAKKDKFQQLQNSKQSIADSFQHIASTVVAIQRKSEDQTVTTTPGLNGGNEMEYTHLPSPQIPKKEYNLVSAFIGQLNNMTRQDWVELAIIEKLYNDKLIDEEYFLTRQQQIKARPPRGQRKGYKQKSTSPNT